MTERVSFTYGPVFDRLWAVVAYESIGTAHISGQRLLWSRERQAWRRAYNYGAQGFSPEPTDAHPDAEYVTSALSLLDRTGDYCPYAPQRREQCGQPIEGDHFLAPGVCSEPVLYCVQRPDKTVVSSSGGTGNMKHWGRSSGLRQGRSRRDQERAHKALHRQRGPINQEIKEHEQTEIQPRFTPAMPSHLPAAHITDDH